MRRLDARYRVDPGRFDALREGGRRRIGKLRNHGLCCSLQRVVPLAAQGRQRRRGDDAGRRAAGPDRRFAVIDAPDRRLKTTPPGASVDAPGGETVWLSIGRSRGRVEPPDWNAEL